jgi:hypothetical protein
MQGTGIRVDNTESKKGKILYVLGDNIPEHTNNAFLKAMLLLTWLYSGIPIT